MDRILSFVAAHWEWAALLCVVAAGVVLGRKACRRASTSSGTRRASQGDVLCGRSAGIPHTDCRKIAQTRGVTQAVVKAFLKELARRKLPPEQDDDRFSEMAASYKELTAKLAEAACGDARVNRLKKRARAALDRGDFGRAEAALRNAIKTDTGNARAHAEAYGEYLASAAETWAAVGELKKMRLMYSEAAECFGRAADLAARVCAPYAGYLDAQGLAFCRAGKHKEAEPLLNRALGIRENELGPDHPDVAESLRDLGELYGARGRFNEAEPLYRRAQEILRNSCGAEDPRCIAVTAKLVRLLSQTGRHQQAREMESRPGVSREKDKK